MSFNDTKLDWGNENQTVDYDILPVFEPLEKPKQQKPEQPKQQKPEQPKQQKPKPRQQKQSLKELFKNKSSTFKTQKCRHALNRRCNRGDKCGYAHCDEELLYKTMICKNGFDCRFGDKCSYAHGRKELRKRFNH